MNSVARSLGETLLTHHEQACRQFWARTPASLTDTEVRGCLITYTDLCNQSGALSNPHGIGRYLVEIAQWCSDHHFRHLHALAVSKAELEPGYHYDGAPGGCKAANWKHDVRECIVSEEFL